MQSKTEQVRVCLLSGNYYNRSQTLLKIKNQLGDFEESIYDETITFEYVYSQVFSSSCFSNQRLIILNSWPKYKETQPTFMKKFKKMLEKVPSDCVLVLNNIKTSPKFIKFVKKIGKVIKYNQFVAKSDAQSFFINELNVRGKNISPENAGNMIESLKVFEYYESGRKNVGIDLDHAYLLIDKLCSFVGKRKNITSTDVFSICIDSKDFIIWNLMTHFDNKNYKDLSTTLLKAFSNEDKIASDANFILTTMFWRYKYLLLLKECASRGMGEKEIKETVSKFKKIKRTGLANKMKLEYATNKKGDEPQQLYSDGMFYVNMKGKYGQKAPILSYSRKEIFMMIKSIEESMMKIRTGCTKSEILLVFDSIAMLICGIINFEQSKKMRRISDGRFC